MTLAFVVPETGEIVNEFPVYSVESRGQNAAKIVPANSRNQSAIVQLDKLRSKLHSIMVLLPDEAVSGPKSTG